jgi:broad specificity polyphosphatase/5'/3'-nucleotidase SurE
MNNKLCAGNAAIKKKVINDMLEEVLEKWGNPDAANINVPLNSAKWEGHVVDESLTASLRVDMQGVSADGYANWQAQFGKGHANCNKGGSYAGVLMRAGQTFTLAEFQEAFKRSFASGATQLCRLDP